MAYVMHPKMVRKLASWRRRKAIWTQAFPPKPVPAKKRRNYAMSAKRRKESREYARLARTFLSSKAHCERKGCWRAATQVHHTHGRGKNYLDASKWVALCGQCHRFIHDHPAAARAEGLLAPKGQWA